MGVSITTQSRSSVTISKPQVEISAATRAAVEIKRQGAQGVAGPAGPSGLGARFYTESVYTEQAPLFLAAGVRTAIALSDIPPGGGVNLFQGAYAGRDTIVGGIFAPQTVGETFLSRLVVQGTSTVKDNLIIAELDIGGTQNVIERSKDQFNENAGDPDELNFDFKGFCLDTFVANGGTIYLTARQDASVWNPDWLHLPLSVPV
jgi:hypothetical protein